MRTNTAFSRKPGQDPVAKRSDGPAKRCKEFPRVSASPLPGRASCAILVPFALRSDSGHGSTRARGFFALRAAPAATAESPSERWMQIFPGFGEDRGPIRLAGKEITDAVILIDQKAYDNLLADCAERSKDPNWPGYLIDIDHSSARPGHASAAAGWARKLEQRDDGLYALCSLNVEGIRVTDNKIYLYRSPEFDLETISAKRFRPVRLAAIALTNVPAYDLKPASAVRAAANPTKGQTMNPEETLAKLREIFGLGPDDDICAAAQTMVDSKAADAEAQRTRECDAFIASNKDAIKDPKAFRTAYLKDPDNAKALFGTLRPATAARRIDASQVRTPAPAAQSDASAQRSAVRAEVARLSGLGIRGTRALQMAERTCGIG